MSAEIKDPEVVQPELEPIMLDRSCVTIEDFKPLCRECDEAPATKVVMLDAWNNGMVVNFGMEMCVECAEEVAERLRDSLPKESENEND